MVHDHELEINAPTDLEPELQSKGFAGGVPINTETSAVNPRAGTECDPRCEEISNSDLRIQSSEC